MPAPSLSSSIACEPLDASAIAMLLRSVTVRWWLSGGLAIDRWLGAPVRDRENSDVSVVAVDLPALVARLPRGFSVWAPVEGGQILIPYAEAPVAADPQPVRVHDDAKGAWVLQVNVEDGASQLWVYKRDPRLTLPWERAVLDIGGIPTGAPEVQLVWKSLRPRPEDDIDKAAVLANLSEEARSWYERAILSIHPHSSWSINMRSPFAPGRASWNRKTV